MEFCDSVMEFHQFHPEFVLNLYLIGRQFCEISTGPWTNASEMLGRTSEKNGVFSVKLIHYSGKLPSGPVKKKAKFAACHYENKQRSRKSAFSDVFRKTSQIKNQGERWS